jgi:isocitrate/isopropylmalate dehydrogenase
MREFIISVIGGGGIGVEVISESMQVVTVTKDAYGFAIKFEKLL